MAWSVEVLRPLPHLTVALCAGVLCVCQLKDYFYYTQLRIQGEDTTSERRATGRIPVSEIPVMMRALGVFPTEAEVDSMVRKEHGGREGGDSKQAAPRLRGRSMRQRRLLGRLPPP